MAMGGAPEGMGDWSLVRVVREGGRQMAIHYSAVLLVSALFLFPASLIKVLYTQLRPEDFVGPQGATDPEPTSFRAAFLYSFFLDLIPKLLYISGFAVMSQTVQDIIYGDDQSQPFRTTLRAALTPRKLETGGDPALTPRKPETEALLPPKKELPATLSGAKLLKALAAVMVMYLLFAVVSTSGLNFTPAATAAMGLPPWSVFLFALLIAVVTTLATGYLMLSAAIVIEWAGIPPTPTKMLDV